MSRSDRACFAQKRNGLVRERSIGCFSCRAGARSSLFPTCVTSELALGSTLGVSIAPNYWEDPNDLEDSENCRSAGGHGNQHVRLRSAQIDGTETICPALAASAASSRGRRPFETSWCHDFKTSLHGNPRIPQTCFERNFRGTESCAAFATHVRPSTCSFAIAILPLNRLLTVGPGHSVRLIRDSGIMRSDSSPLVPAL